MVRSQSLSKDDLRRNNSWTKYPIGKITSAKINDGQNNLGQTTTNKFWVVKTLGRF